MLTLDGTANITPGTLAGTASTGTLTVEQGTVVYGDSTTGAGTGGFQTYVITGGELLLNNATGNINNRPQRHGCIGHTDLSRRPLRIVGNSSASTTETIGYAVTLSQCGYSTITLQANNAAISRVRIFVFWLASRSGRRLHRFAQGVSAASGNGLGHDFRDDGDIQRRSGERPTGRTLDECPARIWWAMPPSSGGGTGFIVQDSITGNLRPLPRRRWLPPLINSATTNLSQATTASMLPLLSATTITLQSGGGQTGHHCARNGWTSRSHQPPLHAHFERGRHSRFWRE